MAELVVVTGISGFIARHVAVELLKSGRRVRGTVRSLTRAESVRRSLADAGANTDELEFAEADLGGDKGWSEALAGADYVQHIASPFPINQPRGREDLVPEAREGALRVVRAALDANVKRVVFTSSMVAMMYRANRPEQFVVRENDWTDPDWEPATPYIISKTRAERAMWDDADQRGARDRIAVVNPGFVLGPSLGRDIGTSLQVIRLIMRGAYPAVPRVSYPIVDVRDLAAVHVAAMTAPGAGGRRLISAHGSLSMADMGRIIRDGLGAAGRKAPTQELPGWAIRALAQFDRSLTTVLADLDAAPTADSAYVSELTGVRFREPEDAVRAAAQSLVNHRLI